MKKITLFLIRIYQNLLSLDHSFWAKGLNIRACIYHPSCSMYTYEAISKYGVIRGLFMGIKRLLKCNIFFKGGFDPVP